MVARGPEYQVVEALARVTPRLLLLTATPEQLGLESHFARLRLLDPHRYPDFDQYVKEHAGYEKAARKANPQPGDGTVDPDADNDANQGAAEGGTGGEGSGD